MKYDFGPFLSPIGVLVVEVLVLSAAQALVADIVNDGFSPTCTTSHTVNTATNGSSPEKASTGGSPKNEEIWFAVTYVISGCHANRRRDLT